MNNGDMYIIKKSSQFKTDIKKYQHNKKLLERLEQVVDFLSNGLPLPSHYKDHDLKGDYAGTRECHLLPDVLLVYKIFEQELVIVALRIGSHSSLFR